MKMSQMLLEAVVVCFLPTEKYSAVKRMGSERRGGFYPEKKGKRVQRMSRAAEKTTTTSQQREEKETLVCCQSDLAPARQLQH